MNRLKRQKMLRKIHSYKWQIICAIGIVLINGAYLSASGAEEQNESTTEIESEEESLVIQTESEEIKEPEVVVEELPPVMETYEEEESEEIEEVEEIKYFDVPLSHELQVHIFKECEKHNIAPAIIIAMIERESSYRDYVIGDNGKSFGLMQIQERYQKDRMERLGCTDLLDPFQNVTVGIDIVAELKDKNPDLYWVLMAYNGGQSYANKRIKSGKISNYALKVAERASELELSIE